MASHGSENHTDSKKTPASILLGISLVLLILTLFFNPLSMKIIIHIATVGLGTLEHPHVLSRWVYAAYIFTLYISVGMIIVGIVTMSAWKKQKLLILPFFLSIFFLASIVWDEGVIPIINTAEYKPLFASQLDMIKTLEDIRKEGRISSDENRILKAIEQQNEAELYTIFRRTSKQESEKVILLTKKLGLHEEALRLKNKGFVEEQDIKNLLDYTQKNKASIDMDTLRQVLRYQVRDP